MNPPTTNEAYLVVYTTLYRTGGPKFERAAQTKAAELEAQGHAVVLRAVESKAAFLAALSEVSANGRPLRELHFFGHSGMYGIMFGTRQWPEQFSPFEWKQLGPTLNLSPDARFYFHACRTGRWFAPFIARTLGVTAYGYQNYTTVSLSPTRFVWEGFNTRRKHVYIIACPGRKSHGLWASVLKYLGLVRADRMLESLPRTDATDTTYDAVAELYANTFEDIVVRADELNWLERKLRDIKPQAVLDIGCGNGAFLNQLSANFERGVGVDLSAGMLNQARLRQAGNAKLEFAQILGPELPFPDNSFDVVTSTLSFRYLDWDPILSEILRVLKPGGQFLVLDMVAAPVHWREWGQFFISKLRFLRQRMLHREYFLALKKMVTSRAWGQMLRYNPIRSEHEMRWFLESRFAGQRAEILNIGAHSRILAFDSGKIFFKSVAKTSYP